MKELGNDDQDCVCQSESECVCVFAVPGTGFIHPIHALLVHVTLARKKKKSGHSLQIPIIRNVLKIIPELRLW